MRMHAQIPRLGNPEYVTDKREKLEMDRIKWVDIDISISAIHSIHCDLALIIIKSIDDWSVLVNQLNFFNT